MESKTSVTNGHIVAMGGGGFSMAPENPLLDDFVLSLSRRQPARVCFIPTASADSTTYIVRFYRSFAGRCIPTDLTLSEGPLPRHSALTSQIARFVAEQDVIYVGGGNTANLLALWRTHGLDVELRKAWSNGAVLAGVSAGMLCWFCGGVTDSYGGLALLRDGLGLVEATACPHYDAQPIIESLRKVRRLDSRQMMVLLFILSAQLWSRRSVLGLTQEPIVLSAPGGGVVETRLPVRFLGAAREAIL